MVTRKTNKLTSNKNYNKKKKKKFKTMTSFIPFSV